MPTIDENSRPQPARGVEGMVLLESPTLAFRRVLDAGSIDAPRERAETAHVDQDKLALLALRVWEYKQGEVVSLMIHLGDELGLYEAMSGAGPLTAAELAAQTGLVERWVLEWLRCQGAAKLIETVDGETFELSGEAAEVLANEDESVWFAAGAFRGAVLDPDVLPRLADAFRTGRGMSYDDLGPSAAHGIERMLAPWTRLVLVPHLIPRLDGVDKKLSDGARVVDVGCGAGVALAALAVAYPASTFEGYDPSVHAVKIAADRMAEAGLDNVVLHLATAEDLPDGPTFDFVLTLDCLHDMPRPAEAIASIRQAIEPDGTWLIKDIRSSSDWTQSLRNPMLALMFGTSVATCMSSALSEPGGAGLGTLGLPPDRLEAMCLDGGFTRFRIHDIDDPANLYYEVRP
jgi:2-polyprenyl-3-methyl-5-hydroxy-6-metoxy-1,4-benzoquinol methylase